MNNEFIFFLMYGVLCGLFGYFAFRVKILIKVILETRRRRKTLPYLEMAHQHLLCKGPHTYSETTLAMAPLPTGDYLVCSECGFVSNGEGSFKLNGPAIEVFRNNISRKKEREARALIAMATRQRLMDDAMNGLVKRYVEKFGVDLHTNAEELKQFFRHAVIEIDDVRFKVDKITKD